MFLIAKDIDFETEAVRKKEKKTINTKRES